MVIGVILAGILALAPLGAPQNDASIRAGLARAAVGAPCTTAGELARAGRVLLGCRERVGVLRWSRTPARIAAVARRAMRTVRTSSVEGDQRHALVINGVIVGVVVGTVSAADDLRTITLDSRDPAQLGARAGSNRYVLTDPATRAEPLAASGCLANNCGREIRNYALLRGTETLNVIVWNGQPLLGSGTPIVPEITIIERRPGEPIGPGTEILAATDQPLIPSGVRERIVLLQEDRVVAVVEGTNALALPLGITTAVLDHTIEVAPNWLRSADGTFIDPDLPVADGEDMGGARPGVGGLPSDAVDDLLTPLPSPPPPPAPWRPSAERIGAPLGGAGDYAIIVNGVVQNVIVLDPQSAGGQSWLQLVAGTSQLPPGALLIKREAGDPVGPGTLVEMPN
jgi:hypothetical protein